MLSWFRKNKKVRESNEKVELESFLERMMHEAVVVDLKCYYIQNSNTPTQERRKGRP